jgi:DNA-binding LacI/PurR family transcriptional regulator/DNA-binding transcriptional regulator YhcF (GntR family)
LYTFCIIYIILMTSIESAHNALRDRLAAGAWRPGERLPSLSQLAEQCKVSRTTMWKAVALLQAERLVHARPRGAIIAGEVSAVNLGFPASPRYPWEHIKESLGRQVMAGEYAAGALPPITKLALEHGVAVDTVKKAVGQLVREGVLKKEGWRISPAQERGYAGIKTVFLIAAGGINRGIIIQDPRTERVIESFERECPRLRLVPRCEGFDPASPAEFLKLKARIGSSRSAAGFIITLWKPWDDHAWGQWLDLIRYLLSLTVPVFVLDQAGDIDFPDDLLKNGQLRVLRLAGVLAGERVAEFMLSIGHHRIAYVSAMKSAAWSQSRLAGLIRRYQRFGPARSCVEPYGLDAMSDANDLMLAIVGLRKPEIRSLFRERLSKQECVDMAERLTKDTITGLRKALARSAAAHTLHAFASFLVGLVRQRHDPGLYDLLLESLIAFASNSAGGPYQRTLFEQVFAASTATAWVCSDDKTALRAVDFLRRKGKQVPKDISVFGFENWREARERQLSTYDFNMPGMVQQAVLSVQDERSFQQLPTISEVEGYVVERRTTGR